MSKLGLVLSGGAFKGLAHVGVLKALEENNIKIDAIAGCSMGAIIGAFYASGRTPKEIEEFVVKQNFRSVLNFSIYSLSKLGINPADKMRQLIEGFTGVTKFSELKIPLYINATNISRETEVVFHRGDLFTAIRASIAVPGIFSPLKINKDYYLDGGVLNNMPVSILPKRIKKFIISDTFTSEKLESGKRISIRDMIEKSILLMMEKIKDNELKKVPKKEYVIIKPNLGKGRLLPNKERFKNIIKIGELAAWKNISKIKRLAKK